MGLKKFAKKAGKDIGKAAKKAGQDVADAVNKAVNQQIIPAAKAAVNVVAQEMRKNEEPKVKEIQQAQPVQQIPAANFQQQLDVLNNQLKLLQEQVKAQSELSTNVPNKNAVVEGAAGLAGASAVGASVKDTLDMEGTEGAAPTAQEGAVTTSDVEKSQGVANKC